MFINPLQKYLYGNDVSYTLQVMLFFITITHSVMFSITITSNGNVVTLQ